VKERKVSVARTTKETSVEVVLNLSRKGEVDIDVEGLPFFEHLLNAMAFHGGFSVRIAAKGDIDVDPHHLVEDVGLVLGEAFARAVQEYGHVRRFGHAVIPMDDALSEATIDVCGRPCLVYRADYPQESAGTFALHLLREFLTAFTNAARINLHALCRYGENGHHMAEALFKAVGKAIEAAYKTADEEAPLSTKGSLG